MITLEQTKEMFELQEKLEIHIGGNNWREANHNYRLCIHMECAEIIDAYGWKHWKDVNKVPDKNAIAMEIVDIWHFGMAFMLNFDNFDVEFVHKQLYTAEKEVNGESSNIEEICLGFTFALYTKNQFPLGNFFVLMQTIGMCSEDLYRLYISKNVLNMFRQDKGYKEGLYKKNWAGREDNEHLYELSEQLGEHLNSQTLYKALEERYSLA